MGTGEGHPSMVEFKGEHVTKQVARIVVDPHPI
jgi:hypothetical protein